MDTNLLPVAATYSNAANKSVLTRQKRAFAPFLLLAAMLFGTAVSARTHAPYAKAVQPDMAQLSNLTVDQGDLSPAFSSSTYTYSDALSADYLVVNITPTVATTGATVTISGNSVPSGSSYGVTLVAGANFIPVVVTSQDGSQTETYTVIINRPASSNAYLNNIILNKAVLSPAFVQSNFNYSVNVANTVSTITATPYTTYPGTGVTVTANSATNPITTGNASAPIPLSVGSNTITLTTTSENGANIFTYTITVNRLAPSHNSALANLSTSPVAISPAFAPGTVTYQATLSLSQSAFTITPTASDTTSTIAVDGTPVTSGSASGSIAVNATNTTHNVVVTATDGSSTTYAVQAQTRSIPPAVSYTTQVFNVGAPVTPLTPTSSDVSYTYNALSTVGGTFNPVSNIAVDPSGNIFTINLSDGIVTEVFASDGHTQVLNSNAFTSPVGIAVNANDDVFIADNYNGGSVSVIHSGSLNVETLASTGFASVGGLALDAAGNIYVTDPNLHCIHKIDANTHAVSTFASGFNDPLNLAIDGAGYVYVTEFGNSDIKKIDPTGTTITTIESGIGAIALGVDQNGNIVFTTNGSTGLYTVASGSTMPLLLSATANSFGYGIGFDSSNNLYTAYFDGANSNSTIHKFNYLDGYNISPALSAGLVIDHATGVISGTPTISQAATDYTVTTYNPAGSTTSTATITVRGNSDLLSNLSLTPGSLNQTFDSNLFSYANATVPGGTATFSLNATPADANAGVTLTDGNNSPITDFNNVPLTLGRNNFIIYVTSVEGAVTNYNLQIIRPLSSNDNLSAIALSQGALNPSFDPATTAYTVNVDGTATSIDVTPTLGDAAATMSVGLNSATSGSPVTVPLSAGPNNITITVTAQDGTSQTYTLTVNRGLADATLSAINPGSGSLSPSFDPATTSYSVSLDNSVSTFQLSAQTTDPGATYTINGAAQAPSYNLAEGPNTFTILVTSGNTLVTNTYTLNVTRAYSPGNTPVGTGTYNSTQTYIINKVITPVVPQIGNPGGSNGYATSATNIVDATTSVIAAAQCVTTDASGNIYAYNQSDSHVYMIPAGGGTPVIWGSANATFISVFGLAVDANGVVYVSNVDFDGGTSGLYKITSQTADADFVYSFIFPTGIAFDHLGNLFINDFGMGDLFEIPAGQSVPLSSAVLASGAPLFGVAADSHNNLYITALSSTVITKISAAALSNTANFPLTTGVSQINNTAKYTGIAVDGAGNIYTGGTAGNGNAAGMAITKIPADGSAGTTLTPTFTGLNNIAMDISGNIYTAASDGIDEIVPAGGYTLSPVLPAGLNFNTNTGIISGKPTAASPATDYTLTVGATTATINIKVIADATLNNLVADAGPLSPAFLPVTTNYSLSVPNATTTVTFTPTINDPAAILTINGSPATSGIPFTTPALNPGDNTFTFGVVSADGTVNNTYTVVVTQALPPIGPPTFAYTNPQPYTTLVPITPLVPSGVTNVDPVGFTSPVIQATGLANPISVAIDPQGNMFVANRDDNTVVKIPAGGGTPIPWGSGFSHPTSIAVDQYDDVDVADYGNGDVKQISPDGVTVYPFQLGIAHPIGIALDKDGDLYVIDADKHTVNYVQNDMFSFEVVPIDTLNAPYSLTVDGNYNIYVTDTQDKVVKEISDSQNLTFTVGSGYTNPTGIASNYNGDLYITDNNTIKEIPATGGAAITLATSGYNSPKGIGVDGNNNLYVADSGNGSVKKLTPSGGYFAITPLPPGLILDNASGTISGTPLEQSDAADYTISAVNHSSSITSTVNIQVLLNTIQDPTVTNIVPSAGNLSPTFNNINNGYNLLVPYTTSSIAFTVSTANPNTTMTINNTPAPTNAASQAFPIPVGTTGFFMQISSQDGTNQSFEFVNLVRAPAPPTLNYGAQVYTPGVPITPYTPVSSGVAGIGYNDVSTPITTPFSGTLGNGIARDGANNLYVTQWNPGAVYKIPVGQQTPVQIGSSSDFNDPSGIAVDKSGNVFVTDVGNGTLEEIPTAGGSPITLLSNINDVRTLVLDVAGNAYYGSRTDGNVYELVAGQSAPQVIASGFSDISAMAIDGAGNIFVADDNTNLITKLSSGTFYTSTFTNVQAPRSISVDPAGNVYIGNAAQTAIWIFAPDGTFLVNSFVDIGGSQTAMDGAGNLYTTDPTQMNTTIHEITPSGGFFLGTRLPIGINFDATTGTISGQSDIAVAAHNYKVTAYNTGSVVATTVNISVANSVNNLSNLTVNTGILSPAFAPSNLKYTVAVDNTISSINVTPTVATTGSTITVNNVAVVSGSSSNNIPLVVGVNNILVVVTAADNSSAQTYKVVVTRAFPIPVLSYASSEVYTVNTLIAPLSPSSKYIAAPAYSTSTISLGSGFSNPASVAVNAAGDVFLADYNLTSVYKISASDGSQVALNGTFSSPASIALDAAGNVYVGDGNTGTVSEIPVNGDPVKVIASGLSYPNSLTVDAANNVYVVDQGNTYVLKKIAPDGTITTITAAGSDGVQCVTLDAAGNLYVSNGNTGSVIKIPVGGGTPVTLQSGFGNIGDIKVDASGNLYIVDLNGGRVNKIPADGSGTITINSFSFPIGLAVSNNGTIYAADNGDGTFRQLNPVGGCYVNPALPAGLIINGTTGVISGTPTKITPPAPYTVIGYNAAGGKTSVTTITVKGAGSSNAGLSGLSIKPTSTIVTLPTVNGILQRSASVAATTTSISILATAADPNATMTINGTPATSGVATGQLPLNTDGTPTVFTIVITAQDQVTTRTVALTITQAGSSNASLADLKVIPAEIITTDATVNGVANRSTSVPADMSTISLLATAVDPNATIRIDGTVVTSGVATGQLPLNDVGTPTVFVVTVTAQDGVTVHTYDLTVNRNGSNQAGLSHWSIIPNVTFVSQPTIGNTAYRTATVAASISTISLLVSTIDPNATMTLNGTAITSGTAVTGLPLNPGTTPTVFTVEVTAQDGVTVRDFVLSVTHQPSGTDLAETYKATDTVATVKPGGVIDLLPREAAIISDNIIVHTAVSPDGDGINDFLKIDGIESYPDNKLTVASSGGSMVYQAAGYNNGTHVFDGHSSTTHSMLQQGTYFYVLQYKVNGTLKSKSGYFVLKY